MRSGLVLGAQLLLRLLLIAIDCLPVLTKLMGGTTAYDRRVARRLVIDEDLHDTESRLQEAAELDTEIDALVARLRGQSGGP